MYSLIFFFLFETPYKQKAGRLREFTLNHPETQQVIHLVGRTEWRFKLNFCPYENFLQVVPPGPSKISGLSRKFKYISKTNSSFLGSLWKRNLFFPLNGIWFVLFLSQGLMWPSLELLIPLSPLPECWAHRLEPPHPASLTAEVTLLVERQSALCMDLVFQVLSYGHSTCKHIFYLYEILNLLTMKPSFPGVTSCLHSGCLASLGLTSQTWSGPSCSGWVSIVA